MTTLADFRVLVVADLGDAESAHSQLRWLDGVPRHERVEQRDWNLADLDAWSEQIGNTLRRSARPALIVAHGFGCLATVHRLLRQAPNLQGALLAAPVDPAHFAIADSMLPGRLPVATILLADPDESRMSAHRSAWWAAQWQSRLIRAGFPGPNHEHSPPGAWPSGLSLLHELAQSLPLSPRCRCRTALSPEDAAVHGVIRDSTIG